MSMPPYILLFFQTPNVTTPVIKGFGKQFVEHNGYDHRFELLPEAKYNHSIEKCTEIINNEYDYAIKANYVLIEYHEDTANNFMCALSALRKENFKNTQHQYRLHYAAPTGSTQPPKIDDFNISLVTMEDFD